MKRQCGECTLCCKLLPVASLAKNANVKCKFQKFHKGCTVYGQPKMPIECTLWTCDWLLNRDTEELSRPDRSHYVIDHVPDVIVTIDNVTGLKRRIQAVVIWCDPNFPDAHRDPKLREYLLRRAAEGKVGMVRYNSYDAVIIFAPPMTTENRWFEIAHKSDNITTRAKLLDDTIREHYKEQFE